MGLFGFLKKPEASMAAPASSVPAKPASGQSGRVGANVPAATGAARPSADSVRGDSTKSAKNTQSLRRTVAPAKAVVPITAEPSASARHSQARAVANSFRENTAVHTTVKPAAKSNATVAFFAADRNATSLVQLASDDRRVRISVTGKQLGQLLLKNAKITEKQLNDGLEIQKKTGEPLGQILVKQKLIGKKTIAEVLKQQFTITTINLNAVNPDPAALALLPPDFCHQRRLVGFELLGNCLCLAMSNALDTASKNEVKSRTGRSIKIFDASNLDVQDAIERWYLSSGEVNKNLTADDASTTTSAKSSADTIAAEASKVEPITVAASVKPQAEPQAAAKVETVETAKTDSTPKPVAPAAVRSGGMKSVNEQIKDRDVYRVLNAIPVSVTYANLVCENNCLSPVDRWLAEVNADTSLPAQPLPAVS